MRKSDLFWQSYLNLEKSFMELSNYIFITDTQIVSENGSEQPCPHQLDTFSPYICDMLVQCCIQIEAVSKELYYDSVGSKAKWDITIHFDEDCLKEIDKRWGTHDKNVLVTAFSLAKPENYILRPLKEAHKRGGAYWERAYQAVKHDRYTSLAKGNVKALLNALAALYLLNLYYRNDCWLTSYQEIKRMDMSCGSKIFAVYPPEVSDINTLCENNMPVISTSPYIAVYQDTAYKNIKNMKDEYDKELLLYLLKQPELKEAEFRDKIPDDINIWPLAGEIWKFRLRRKIPASLTFEERKRRLLESEERHNAVIMVKGLKKPEDITENNIQAEIDITGIEAGVCNLLRYRNLKWLGTALNDKICEVKIPDSI